MREPAHRLQEQLRAMARRGRRLPDLRISAPSVVARILVWAGDATDFRPSINGAGGACPSRHMVCESSRERWRDGAGCCRTSGFRPLGRCMHIGAGGRGDATDFRPSINGAGGACASRHTVRESSRERWRDDAGSLPDLRISAPSGFARILVWASDATDSRPSINGGATVPVAAHRLRACQRWRTGAVGSQTSEIR